MLVVSFRHVGLPSRMSPIENLENLVQSLLAEAVRFPTLVDVFRAGKVLENSFQMMPRAGVTTNAPIEIERREKRTAAALLPLFVLFAHLRLIRPLCLVKSLRVVVRPAIGDDLVLIHTSQ